MPIGVSIILDIWLSDLCDSKELCRFMAVVAYSLYLCKYILCAMYIISELRYTSAQLTSFTGCLLLVRNWQAARIK